MVLRVCIGSGGDCAVIGRRHLRALRRLVQARLQSLALRGGCSHVRRHAPLYSHLPSSIWPLIRYFADDLDREVLARELKVAAAAMTRKIRLPSHKARVRACLHSQADGCCTAVIWKDS